MQELPVSFIIWELRECHNYKFLCPQSYQCTFFKWRITCRLTTLSVYVTSGLWSLQFSCDLGLGLARWRFSPLLLQHLISLTSQSTSTATTWQCGRSCVSPHLADLHRGACISATCAIFPTVISAFKSLSFISIEVTYTLRWGNTLFPLT